MNDTAAAIQEMLNAWDIMVTAAKKLYPAADDETIYQMCRDAMKRSLGL